MSGVEGAPGLLRGLSIPVSGLSAQRRRMDAIAMNVANAQTTRTPEGGAYQRRVVTFEQAPDARNAAPTARLGDIRVPEVPPAGSSPARAEPGGVLVSGIELDPSEGPLVYEPGHPDADELGYVRYPNVDLTQETIALMETRRAYEANATVFEAMKSMLHHAIDI